MYLTRDLKHTTCTVCKKKPINEVFITSEVCSADCFQKKLLRGDNWWLVLIVGVRVIVLMFLELNEGVMIVGGFGEF